MIADQIEITGEYTGTGYLSEYDRIAISRTNDGPFTYLLQMSAPEAESNVSFQIYRIGETLLVVAGDPDVEDSGVRLFIFKVDMADSAIHFFPLGQRYFLQNPNALPATQITRSSGGGLFGRGSDPEVHLGASPQELAEFFKAQEIDQELFGNRALWTLNRIEK